jgi:hypothetical protein
MKIWITAPVTAKTRRVVYSYGGTIIRDDIDRSARIVIIPGYCHPQVGDRIRNELYDAQAAAR